MIPDDVTQVLLYGKTVIDNNQEPVWFRPVVYPGEGIGKWLPPFAYNFFNIRVWTYNIYLNLMVPT